MQFLTDVKVIQRPVICSKCWNYISDFNTFQLQIFETHSQLLEVLKTSAGDIEEGKTLASNVQNVENDEFNIASSNTPLLQPSITIDDEHYEPNILSVETVTTTTLGDTAPAYCDNVPIEIISSDENSQTDDDDDYMEFCEDDDDPVGVFLGGEFSNGVENPTGTVSTTDSNMDSVDELISQWRSTLECIICSKRINKFSSLLSHFDVFHPGEECRISCCSRFHKGSEAIRQHAQFHTDTKTYKCLMCNSSFDCVRLLRVHCKDVHSPTNTCTHCGKVKHMLEHHIVSDNGVTLYQCVICERSFNILSNFRRHCRKLHKNEWLEGFN